MLAGGYDALRADLWRGGALVASASARLVDPGGGAPFDLALPIEAGCQDHALLVVLVAGGVDTPVARRERLVAGDVVLVTGQSNAAAYDFHGEGLANQSQGPWIRLFGTASTFADFGFASGFVLTLDRRRTSIGRSRRARCRFTHGSIGAWVVADGRGVG